MTPKITPTTIQKPYHPQWWYNQQQGRRNK